MRRPIRWDDKSLLQDEPFKSAFPPRMGEKEGKKKGKKKQNTNTDGKSLAIKEKLSERIKDMPYVVDAYVEWVDLAFAEDNGSIYSNVPREEIIGDQKLSETFVFVFEQLSKGNGTVAMAHINEARNRTGLRTKLTLSGGKESKATLRNLNGAASNDTHSHRPSMRGTLPKQRFSRTNITNDKAVDRSERNCAQSVRGFSKLASTAIPPVPVLTEAEMDTLPNPRSSSMNITCDMTADRPEINRAQSTKNPGSSTALPLVRVLSEAEMAQNFLLTQTGIIPSVDETLTELSSSDGESDVPLRRLARGHKLCPAPLSGAQGVASGTIASRAKQAKRKATDCTRLLPTLNDDAKRKKRKHSAHGGTKNGIKSAAKGLRNKEETCKGRESPSSDAIIVDHSRFPSRKMHSRKQKSKAFLNVNESLPEHPDSIATIVNGTHSREEDICTSMPVAETPAKDDTMHSTAFNSASVEPMVTSLKIRLPAIANRKRCISEGECGNMMLRQRPKRAFSSLAGGTANSRADITCIGLGDEKSSTEEGANLTKKRKKRQDFNNAGEAIDDDCRARKRTKIKRSRRAVVDSACTHSQGINESRGRPRKKGSRTKDVITGSAILNTVSTKSKRTKKAKGSDSQVVHRNSSPTLVSVPTQQSTILPSFAYVGQLAPRGRLGPALEGVSYVTAERMELDERINEGHSQPVPGGKEEAEPVSYSDLLVAKTDKTMTPAKSPLPRDLKPKIWAQSRQAVCEAFQWFRSFQSGVYFSGGEALGYLLSGFPSLNDSFYRNGKLIISHGGGKTKVFSDHKGGNKRLVSSDQEESDYGVRSLIACHKSGNRIVLLADDKYQLFPYDLKTTKYTFVVLGSYRVVDYWAELEKVVNSRGYCVKYKFAFEWCDEQGEPWWHVMESPTDYDGNPARPRSGLSDIVNLNQLPENELQPSSNELLDNQVPTELFEGLSASCRRCRRKSRTVYEEGWACLRPDCNHFCFLPNASVYKSLTYSPAFLKSLTHNGPPLDEFEIDITPAPPPTFGDDSFTTNKEFARGWWCRCCGRLCCRERWECWYCSNCGNKVPITPSIRDHKDFWGQEARLEIKWHRIFDSRFEAKTSQWIEDPPNAKGMLTMITFPATTARIYVIHGHPTVNGTADELLQEYQEEAFTYEGFFIRYPLITHALRGEMLTNYFSQNSGAPYKYVAGTNNTVPFERAPQAVRKALALIKTRASAGLGKPVDFNEILSAAYLQTQKMSYHSDSEAGMGPTVSSLSLGSIALMHFRPAKVKGNVNAAKKVLTLVLRHGDVLVMDGADIQTKYEHMVEPMDFRIAATARMIGEGERAKLPFPVLPVEENVQS